MLPIVSIVLGIVLLILAILSLVYWIKEIIAAFDKEEKPLMGILSIVGGLLCSGIVPFIIGWIHAEKWGIKPMMVKWTIVSVLAIIVAIIFQIFVLGAAASLRPVEGLPEVPAPPPGLPQP